MRSRFSKHPSRFVDRTRRRRERTFRSATAFSRRPLGAGISHLQDIAVLAEKVRSRFSPTSPSGPPTQAAARTQPDDVDAGRHRSETDHGGAMRRRHENVDPAATRPGVRSPLPHSGIHSRVFLRREVTGSTTSGFCARHAYAP